jgi:hypothetical protein
MERFGNRLLAATIAVLMMLTVTAGAAGRIEKSSLTGVAVDSSGAALPGVTVMLKPAAAAPQTEPQEQVTDGTGRFTFEELEAGT